jgi:ribosome recycling factor
MTTALDVLATAEDKMGKALQATHNELATIRTGRANPALLDRVLVDYYGTPTPIRQMANVSVAEGTVLVIQPYERNQLADIERSIAKSDLGLNPNNDGSVIRITVPALNEERRRELVKMVKKMGEEGKIAVRNIRRDAADDLNKLKKDSLLTEDELRTEQERLQKLTDKHTKELDAMMKTKEDDVMHV